MNELHSQLFRGISSIFGKEVSGQHVTYSCTSYLLCNCICIVDQACFVKIAEYWPTSFCSFLWTETKSREKKHTKKNDGNIQPS